MRSHTVQRTMTTAKLLFKWNSLCTLSNIVSDNVSMFQFLVWQIVTLEWDRTAFSLFKTSSYGKSDSSRIDAEHSCLKVTCAQSSRMGWGEEWRCRALCQKQSCCWKGAQVCRFQNGDIVLIIIQSPCLGCVDGHELCVKNHQCNFFGLAVYGSCWKCAFERINALVLVLTPTPFHQL